jgi:2-keto-4-pentenoate hydratase/2-oxohepta-3-ene-1,7-dioic acid hydratase in catechol pathway
MTERPRFSTVIAGGQQRFGRITDTGFVDASSRLAGRWSSLSAVVEDNGLAELDRLLPDINDFALTELTFQPPLLSPEKIICVGVNFPDRNAEYKDGQSAPQNMSLFIRFARSFTGHGQPLIRPKVSDQLDYEGEIAVVLGKGGRHIAQDQAYNHIAAVTVCNEGTLRDWVRHAKFNVTQGKNFDRSGAMGPWLVPFDSADQLDDIQLQTRVNGELRQDDRTSRMIFPISRQIAYISTFTTLVPGDIIITGTPTGAGARFDPPRFLKPGDRIEVEAEGIGTLSNGVEDEE